MTKNVQLYAKVDNVFDNRYYTYGTFFDTTAVPNFANGGAAFTDPRSLTPAQTARVLRRHESDVLTRLLLWDEP